MPLASVIVTWKNRVRPEKSVIKPLGSSVVVAPRRSSVVIGLEKFARCDHSSKFCPIASIPTPKSR